MHGGETHLIVLAEALNFGLQQAADVHQLVHAAFTAEPWQIKTVLVMQGSDLHSAVEAENGRSWLPGTGV